MSTFPYINISCLSLVSGKGDDHVDRNTTWTISLVVIHNKGLFIMTHKFLLMYINKDNVLVTRILDSKELGPEKIYKIETEVDLSARKRRDILIHHISPTNDDDIEYIMTISTAKPKETIIGTKTAVQFMEDLYKEKESQISLFTQLVAHMNNGQSMGQFNIQ